MNGGGDRDISSMTPEELYQEMEEQYEARLASVQLPPDMVFADEEEERNYRIGVFALRYLVEPFPPEGDFHEYFENAFRRLGVELLAVDLESYMEDDEENENVSEMGRN